MTADTIVRSRIDAATKERAAAALEAMGLTISDAIRLLLLRVADEKRLPFEVKVRRARGSVRHPPLPCSRIWISDACWLRFARRGSSET